MFDVSFSRFFVVFLTVQSSIFHLKNIEMRRVWICWKKQTKRFWSIYSSVKILFCRELKVVYGLPLFSQIKPTVPGSSGAASNLTDLITSLLFNFFFLKLKRFVKKEIKKKRIPFGFEFWWIMSMYELLKLVLFYSFTAPIKSNS